MLYATWHILIFVISLRILIFSRLQVKHSLISHYEYELLQLVEHWTGEPKVTT